MQINPMYLIIIAHYQMLISHTDKPNCFLYSCTVSQSDKFYAKCLVKNASFIVHVNVTYSSQL